MPVIAYFLLQWWLELSKTPQYNINSAEELDFSISLPMCKEVTIHLEF